jgi:predicted HicB family RNase H-like nuclease
VIEMPESGKNQIITSLRVDPELWKKARVEAIKHDMSLADLVGEAIEMWIDKKARQGGKKGV